MSKALFVLFFLLTVQAISAQNISIELNKNWQFKDQKENKWYKATVPGTVHTDLLANKLIPDPFYRDNESKLQWIDKADWEYKTVFNVDPQTFSKKNIELIFDGLDTYADVYLNGKLILQADNMFRRWTVDVKSIIKRTNNILLLKFASAQNKVDSIAKAGLPLVLPDNNRIYVRKAQFQFGWDWGAKFVGCGIWKQVKLLGWDMAKINSLRLVKVDALPENPLDSDYVWLKTLDSEYVGFIYLEISITANKSDSVEISLFDPTFNNYLTSHFGFTTDTNSILKHSSTSKIKLIRGINKIPFRIPFRKFKNWYPDKVGNKLPPELRINIWYGKLGEADNSGTKEIIYEDAITYKLANYNNVLIQQADSIGKSFYFQINGKPIYAKGANWIPGDVFLPRLTKDDYRKMLQSAKDANMNMLRVWGGGVYESDDFYDLCDSLGIMVWQDFMFAGGMYPGDEAFMNNVREEVQYQIGRLRHHPCIVLWCGNNEVEEAWKNWGWQNQFNLHGADSAKVWNDYKRLFQDSLKKWVAEFDGTRPYVSTSPKNGWGHKESFTEGDSHYWGVWWGLENWEAFEKKTGRFVSEYGMQAMPNWNTVKSFTDSTDRYLYSPVIKDHQKASEGFKKLNHYLTRYFIDSAKLSRLSLEDYTYLTQCMQYYILKNSIATHRGKYPANMGTLLWQLNDCWPVTSWSITDYSRQPKAAWYAVKEAYRDDAMPARDSVYPKDMQLLKPDFVVMQQGNRIMIRSTTYAKYVEINFPGNNISFSDNYFDLVPGASKIITVAGDTDAKDILTKIKIRSLYDILKAQ